MPLIATASVWPAEHAGGAFACVCMHHSLSHASQRSRSVAPSLRRAKHPGLARNFPCACTPNACTPTAQPVAFLIMAATRPHDDADHARPSKKPHKGFSVGPANLPDGTHRRKGDHDPAARIARTPWLTK